MTTRTLSAWFEDYRQGKKDFALLQSFLMQVFDQEPVRRGHLLHWLDQAQYEHPIPVTDFLLLRKEVEIALKNGQGKAGPDDATVIADSPALAVAIPRPAARATPSPAPLPPVIPSPEMTLVATQEATAAATRAVHPDATVVAQAATQIALPVDPTPLAERSDHAGFHDAATSFNPERQPAPAPARANLPPQRLSRLPLIAGGCALVILAALGGVLLKQLVQHSTPAEPAPTSSNQSEVSAANPAAINQLLRDAPTASIGGSIGDNSALRAAESTDSAPVQPAQDNVIANPATAFGEEPAPLPDLNTLDAAALLQLVHARIGTEQLLPADDPASAHAAFRALERRFADDARVMEARILLKDAHLKLSDQARSQGQWEAAQQHLDAAFEVLQPDGIRSASATAPSAGS